MFIYISGSDLRTLSQCFMILLNFELSSSLSPDKISESLMSFCFMGKQKEYRVTLTLMNVSQPSCFRGWDSCTQVVVQSLQHIMPSMIPHRMPGRLQKNIWFEACHEMRWEEIFNIWGPEYPWNQNALTF